MAPVGLNLIADALLSDNPDAKLVDPTKLNLAKLTLTERVENPTSDRLELQFPSTLSFQFSRQGRKLESTLSFQKYFGRLGYRFLNENRALVLNYGLNLDIAFSVVQFSLGGIKGKLIEEKEGRAIDRSPLWVPHFSAEVTFFLLKNYQASSKLFLAPTPGVGVKVGYFF